MARKPYYVHEIKVGNNTLFVSNNKIGVNSSDPNVAVDIRTTDAIRIPAGNTSQRPSGANAFFRYNSETNEFEGYANGAWGGIGAGGGYYKGNLGEVGKESSINNIFRINGNTLSTNTTIETGENVSCAGPLTVANGVTLTVQTGARVAIV